MKKLYLLPLFVLFIVAVRAGVGCIPDSSNTRFFSPRPDSLPCIERTVFYAQTIQIAVPDSINLKDFYPALPFNYILYVDSFILDSVKGLPTDMYYSLNPYPAHYHGGKHACTELYGTTSDPAGTYPITLYGTMKLHGTPFPPIFSGDTTMRLQDLQSNPNNPFNASLTVINPGDSCRPAAAGINDFSAALNASVRIYPNPSGGSFRLSVNCARKSSGLITVMDMSGRKVFEKQIDDIEKYSESVDLSREPKGIYLLRIKTPEAVGSRNFSIE